LNVASLDLLIILCEVLAMNFKKPSGRDFAIDRTLT
jgi:hypothetical protein